MANKDKLQLQKMKPQCIKLFQFKIYITQGNLGYGVMIKQVYCRPEMLLHPCMLKVRKRRMSLTFQYPNYLGEWEGLFFYYNPD